MNWALIIQGILSAAEEIRARHAADNPGAPPLTDAQVKEKLVADLSDANSNINAFFVENGLPLPE